MSSPTPLPAPGLPWHLRAVQLDLARQMETVDFIYRYIDFAASVGFNTLFLYLEGRVATPSFSFRPHGTTYTLDEMARVVRHGYAAGVEVVPGIASLGHAEQFLSCPELAHLAEERDGQSRFGRPDRHTFCPSLPETYDFLTRYCTELAEVFTTPHLHIGGDEAWNLGFCRTCRAKWEQDGLGSLFTNHLQRMLAICRGLGKRMWIWDDLFELFPDELERAPREMVMCHWDYDIVIEPEGAQAHFVNRRRRDWLADYARLGIDTLICPSPFVAAGNITSFTDYGRRHPVLGGILTQWEMSSKYHEELAPAVAFTGKLWSGADFNPERAWTDGMAAVLPDASPALVEAVRTLVNLPGKWPPALLRHYLAGPLGADELLLREALRSGLALLAASRPAGESPILDDIETSARLSQLRLDLRELLPKIYDLRRLTTDTPLLVAKATACRQELDALLTRRAPLQQRLRPDMHPTGGADRYLCALRDALQPAWERLARDPVADDWLLVLRLFLPDAFGAPRLEVSARIDGIWQPLASGVFKPLEQSGRCYYTQQLPFTAAQPPDAVRLEVWGYGGQGVTYLEMRNPTLTRVPYRVSACKIPVEHPDAVLRDDSQWTYLGCPDIMTAIHVPEQAEERAMIEIMLS